MLLTKGETYAGWDGCQCPLPYTDAVEMLRIQNAKTAWAIVDWLSNPTVATPVHAAEARILAASIIRNMLIAAGIERP